MTRTPRRLALAAAAGLAVLTLSGCGDAPVRSGSAATVGDVRISTGELEGYVTRGLSDPQAQQQLGADKAAFQRRALAQLINHQVLAEAAKRESVTVTNAAVDRKTEEFAQQAGGPQQLIQQAAQNGIAKQDLRRFISDVALNEALGDKLTEDISVPDEQLKAAFQQYLAENDKVHTAHILVADEALAKDILAQVKADPSKFDALAAKYSTDTSNKDKGGDLGFAKRGSFVKPFEDAVFGAKSGDFLIVKTEFGWHVVHVIERTTPTLAEVTPQLRRLVLQQPREERTTELLTKVSADLDVKVNPRFGKWNPKQGSVDAIPVDGNSVSSPAPGSETGGDTGGAGTESQPPPQG